jgi:hypothetical protein
MTRVLRHRPSPAMVVALVALFVAMGGGAYAAIKLPKNSVGSKQIKKNAVTSAKVKNGSLRAGDFTKSGLPAGAQGPAGPAGATGARGPSNAFSTFKAPSVNAPPAGVVVAQLGVPAGSYVIIGKAVAFEGDAAQVAQGSCTLAAGANTDVINFGLDTSSTVFNSLPITSTVVQTFGAPATITWTCQRDAGPAAGFAVANRKLTAIQVATLSNTPLAIP